MNDRLQIPGLESRRTDIIIAGAAILKGILTHIGLEEIRVSTRGLRYGVTHDRFVQYNPSVAYKRFAAETDE